MNSTPSRFPVLDGIRALSIIWLVAFHGVWFMGFFMPPAEFVRMLHAGGLATYLVMHGHLGVDLFFALSGFLITHVLLAGPPAGEGMLATFYRRRAFRILPIYVAVALIYAMTAGQNLGSLWANALFVNNYLPVANQAMAWTWSLAIEEQFYLFFPLIFLACRRSARGLLAVVVGLTVVALGIRAIVIFASAPWEAMPFHPMVDGPKFFAYFDTLYGRTHMRISGLFFGIIARLLLEDRAVHSWFETHRRQANAGLAIALGVLATVVLAKLGLEVAGQEVTLRSWSTFLDRPLFSAAAAYVMLYALVLPDSRSRLIRVLGHRMWKPWAEVSYAAFLLNPIVFGIFGMIYRNSLQSVTLRAFTTYFSLSVATTFALASVLFHGIESPIRRLGRGGPQGKRGGETGSLPSYNPTPS